MSSTDAAWATTIDRDVVRAEGPDAATFLQGQLSQDVDAMAVSTSTWTFALAPTGRVDAWFRLTKSGADSFLLDVDAGHGQQLHDRLARFLLRTKADLDVVTWPMVAVRGVDAPTVELEPTTLRLPAIGPGVAGHDLLGPEASPPPELAVSDEVALRVHDVERGIPRMGHELTDAVIPAELGEWIIDESVSFTKGCFVGQELVARIDSRGGNVPRRLRGLVLDEPVEAGTPVDADGPPSVVTSSAVSDRHGPIGLAFCGRAVEPGAEVRAGGVRGVVHTLPLDRTRS